MQKLSDWKLARKIQNSSRRGVILGLTIAAVVCLITAGIIIKLRWLRKNFGHMHYNLDDFGDDCDCDENGCAITSEKDFV